MGKTEADIERSYDRVAGKYVEEYFNELERKPFDRALLDEFASAIRDEGIVCEIGCGPGQVARYLKDRGVDMCGIDLSSEMVRRARELNPDIHFAGGNMRRLEAADDSFAAIVCFYAIIHLHRQQVPEALREMRRTIRPDGRLLLSFHGGDGEIERDEWFGEGVAIFATLFGPEEMSNYITEAGFEIERVVQREPYEFEYPTRRVYLLARKPRPSE